MLSRHRAHLTVVLTAATAAVLATAPDDAPGMAVQRTVVSRSDAADPATKAALYRDLGLRLAYDHDEQEVEAEISTAEACAKGGVRGATRYFRTRFSSES